MILSYEYGTEKIEFNVIFRKRKTFSIQIESSKIITVIVPKGTPEEKILEIVKTKSKWIVTKLFEIKEIEHRIRKIQYINGESFIYIGRNYSLQIIYDENIKTPEAKLFRGKLYVYTYTKDEDIIKQALVDWYKKKAQDKIEERIKYYQLNFDTIPKRIIVKEQRRRWGSCNSNQELRFNWRIIMAPTTVLDYIVVHEMCHMVHMNHSKEYWQLVKSILPDYEHRKEILKNNGIKYDL